MAQPLARNLGLEVHVADLLDPRRWVERYFWPVVDNAAATPHPRLAGKTMLDAVPPASIANALASSLASMSRHVGIDFALVRHRAPPVEDGARQGDDYDVLDDRLPYVGSRVSGIGYQLHLPPNVVSVSRVRGVVFGEAIVDVDADDADTGEIVAVNRQQGAFVVRPATVSPISAGGAWANLIRFAREIQAFWAVDYVTGYVSAISGRAGYVPADLADYVCLDAGIQLLNMLGTMATKGVSSTSLGFDGFSKSVSLQASAMYGVNSALEKVFIDRMQRIDLEHARSHYRGIQVCRYGG